MRAFGKASLACSAMGLRSTCGPIRHSSAGCSISRRDDVLVVGIPDGQSPRLLWEAAAGAGEQIRYLRPQRSTLEEVFLGTTGQSAKLTTLKDLLALAKAKPGAVTYGAPGHGGSPHLAGALLENLSGTKMSTSWARSPSLCLRYR